jgi:hypothetical protein
VVAGRFTHGIAWKLSSIPRGDLGFGQLLSSHHSCLPGILRPTDQPIQARESIRVLRLRPKVRQTAALLAPLYLERRATGHGKP